MPTPPFITVPPAATFDKWIDRLTQSVQPPDWLVAEAQQRLVLLLNHVLQQEGAAVQRLKPLQGQSFRLAWRQWHLTLIVTPAGLLDVAPAQHSVDLTVEILQPSPTLLAQQALRGEKPPVRIEGDVQLAAHVQWLADHVRWDLEEDVARIVGDPLAHSLSQAAQQAVQALRRFVQQSSAAAATAKASP